MSKPSEIQESYNELINCIKDMSKSAGGLNVTDMAAIKGMTDAVIKLKTELAEKEQELSDLKASIPKIKADAVLSLLNTEQTCETPNGDNAWSSSAIEEHANKLEAGE